MLPQLTLDQCEVSRLPHLIQSPLPALLPLHHQLDAVGQGGQDPRCGGFESDGLSLEINPVRLLKVPL